MSASALTRVSRAAAKSRRARADFEAEIRRAVAEQSMRKVAEAAGLTVGRIHQIVHGR